MAQTSTYDQRAYTKKRKTGRRRAAAQNAFKLKILAGISKKHIYEQNTWINERHGVLVDYEPLQYLTIATGDTKRQGTRIYVTGTQLRRVIRLPSSDAPTTTSWIRIVCCLDRQPSETNYADFFDNSDTGDTNSAADYFQSSGVTNNNNVNRLIRPLNKRRYEILYDQVFKLGIQQNTGNLLYGDNSERIIQTPYIPVNRVIGFDATSSGNTNPSPNIHWFHFYENTADSNLVFHDNKYIYHTYFKDL